MAVAPRRARLVSRDSSFKTLSEARPMADETSKAETRQAETRKADTSKPVKKVVLAYSGGLDTSIILKWLQTEYGAGV